MTTPTSITESTLTVEKVMTALARVGGTVMTRQELQADHPGLLMGVIGEIRIVRFDTPQAGLGKYVALNLSTGVAFSAADSLCKLSQGTQQQAGAAIRLTRGMRVIKPEQTADEPEQPQAEGPENEAQFFDGFAEVDRNFVRAAVVLSGLKPCPGLLNLMRDCSLITYDPKAKRYDLTVPDGSAAGEIAVALLAAKLSHVKSLAS